MSIRWRLTLFNALAIGTILILLGVFLFTSLSSILPSGVENTVQGRALEAAHTIGAGKKLSPKQVDRLTLNGVYVIVRDGQGRVLARTVNIVPRDNGRNDTAWRRALVSGNPAGGEANLSPEPPDYVYAVPVKPPGGARVVEAGKSYESAREALNVFGVSLAVGIVVALLLAVVGAYFLARTALSPVDAVVASARRITEGDLSRRLPVANRRDEIGRLTRTINSLLSRLESAFARREETLARQRSFTADASHELRTPLTSISGYAGMLDEWALEDPEAARRAVAAIQRESERMKTLVEELLVLARGDEGVPLRPSRQSLDVLAGEAVRRARDAIGGGEISVGYEPSGKLVEATFDRDRIRQVADIFLDNAAKYTPEGGKVRVAVREEDGWALLEVSDTGVGIPEEQLPLIFERFYRADSARAAGGAGLGLSIARQIAEAHGGTVEAESEPGKGSTFTLKLRKDGAAV